MRNIIILEYSINLIILSSFYMYMFQLNSYIFQRQVDWMKANYKKVIIQILLIMISFLLTMKNYNIFNIIAIILLGISIYCNIPKKKCKVSFNITNRVIRMFITEIIIYFIILGIGEIKKLIIMKLFILNILSIFACVIVNIINMPIQYLINKRYINQAKNMLKEKSDLIVIGVTGSYGKTSVKNFLVKTLSTKYEVLTTPKNYNTTMGVVKTIREDLKSTHQIFVCEMGAYKQRRN